MKWFENNNPGNQFPSRKSVFPEKPCFCCPSFFASLYTSGELFNKRTLPNPRPYPVMTYRSSRIRKHGDTLLSLKLYFLNLMLWNDCDNTMGFIYDMWSRPYIYWELYWSIMTIQTDQKSSEKIEVCSIRNESHRHSHFMTRREEKIATLMANSEYQVQYKVRQKSSLSTFQWWTVEWCPSSYHVNHCWHVLALSTGYRVSLINDFFSTVANEERSHFYIARLQGKTLVLLDIKGAREFSGWRGLNTNRGTKDGQQKQC